MVLIEEGMKNYIYTVPLTAEKVHRGISIESKHRKMKMMGVTR